MHFPIDSNKLDFDFSVRNQTMEQKSTLFCLGIFISYSSCVDPAGKVCLYWYFE